MPKHTTEKVKHSTKKMFTALRNQVNIRFCKMQKDDIAHWLKKIKEADLAINFVKTLPSNDKNLLKLGALEEDKSYYQKRLIRAKNGKLLAYTPKVEISVSDRREVAVAA